jgi:hypothetical protein
MKTDRFRATSIRATAVLLAGALLAAGHPAAGARVKVGPLSVDLSFENRSKKVAAELAGEVREVSGRFDERRRALQTVQPPGGKPAYSRPAVRDLIARTEQDLDQGIGRVSEDLSALRDWAADELQRIQTELAATSARAAVSSPRGFTSRPVAVVASLGGLPLPIPASAKAAAPAPDTVPVATADRLLDQVGEVISRIFFLAERNDVYVKLWVGSTPAAKAKFDFWSQGRIKGSTAESTLRTNGKLEVPRGLYSYRARLAQGQLAKLIQFPPTGTSAAQLMSERLDLVNSSSYFCCQFDASYCHHVANEKECRP